MWTHVGAEKLIRTRHAEAPAPSLLCHLGTVWTIYLYCPFTITLYSFFVAFIDFYLFCFCDKKGNVIRSISDSSRSCLLLPSLGTFKGNLSEGTGARKVACFLHCLCPNSSVITSPFIYFIFQRLLGRWFFDRQQYQTAVQHFKLALVAASQ